MVGNWGGVGVYCVLEWTSLTGGFTHTAGCITLIKFSIDTPSTTILLCAIMRCDRVGTMASLCFYVKRRIPS